MSAETIGLYVSAIWWDWCSCGSDDGNETDRASTSSAQRRRRTGQTHNSYLLFITALHLNPLVLNAMRVSTANNVFYNSKCFYKSLGSADCVFCNVTCISIQSGPEKIAKSLMHRHFATMYSRITRFLPECSEINWQHPERANFECYD